MPSFSLRVCLALLLSLSLGAMGCRSGQRRSGHAHSRTPIAVGPQGQPAYEQSPMQNGPQLPTPYDGLTVPPVPPIEIDPEMSSDPPQELSGTQRVWRTLTQPVINLVKGTK